MAWPWDYSCYPSSTGGRGANSARRGILEAVFGPRGTLDVCRICHDRDFRCLHPRAFRDLQYLSAGVFSQCRWLAVARAMDVSDGEVGRFIDATSAAISGENGA